MAYRTLIRLVFVLLGSFPWMSCASLRSIGKELSTPPTAIFQEEISATNQLITDWCSDAKKRGGIEATRNMSSKEGFQTEPLPK